MDMKKIAAALKRVETREGRLTPEAVLAAAKDRKSVLHGMFEWDDSAAAQKWRLEQARDLIRSIKVEFSNETKTYRTVAYVRDPQADSDQQGYRSVVKLRGDSDEAREAVVAAFAAASAHLRRARDLAVVLGHGEAVAELLAQVTAVDRRIQLEGAQA